MPLFDGVAYHISKSIPEQTRREISRILDANGAVDAALDGATHVVSDTIDFEGANTLQTGAACVTPGWVERSMELGVLQDPKYYSADKEMIFSGIVATSAGIPPCDKEVIIAGIKESGGQWREALTRDVTHLFVTNTSNPKYNTAMHFRDSANITILLPQWFDQCWSMQMRLPHDVFEFPDPPYMHNDHDVAMYRAQMFVNPKAPGGQDKSATVRAMNASSSAANSPIPTRDIWQGRKILLSSSLALDARRRESVEERIRRNGGVVVAPDGGDADETAAVARADVLVTQYRTGPAYARALAADKIIGTLAWMFSVEHSGAVSSPRDHLLHYPAPNKPIPNFTNHVITVTNYQGEDREYLKKLIDIMGAKFTPTMSGRNTIVVAAYKHGNKTEKAEEWSVPIVTHKWLEDCFIEWRNLTPAQKKYIDFAPGVNYGAVIGGRGVGRVGLEEPDLPPEQDTSAQVSAPDGVRKDQKADAEEPQKKSPEKKGATEPFSGTATSTRDAREVEEVEDVLKVGGDVEFVDEVRPPAGAEEDYEREQAFTPKKVGPPRGVKKTPAKAETTLPELKSKSKSSSVQELNKDVWTPPRKGTKKTKPLLEENDNDDSDEEAPRTSKPLDRDSDGPPTRSRVTEKPKPRPKPAFGKKPALASEKVTGPDEDDAPTAVRKKSTLRKASDSMDEDDDDAKDRPRSKLKPKPRPGKKEAHQPTPINVDTDEVGSGVDETPPRVIKSPPKTYRSKTKAKAKAAAVLSSDPESEDSVQELPAKKSGNFSSPSAPKRGLMPSPAHILSVELPDPRAVVKSRARTPERRDSVIGSKSASSPAKSSPVTRYPKPPPRTTSIRATTHGVPSVELLKRSRTTATHDTEGSPSHHRVVAKPVKKSVSDTSSRATPTPPPIQRTPSRRSAAAAATQRLRNDVMPDVMSYEKEVKNGARGVARRRKTSSTAEIEDDGDGTSERESEAKGKKKRKVASNGNRKNKSARKGEEDEEDIPPVKFVTHVPSKKRSVPTDDDDDGAGPVKRHSQYGARKKVHIETSVSDDGSVDEVEPRQSSWDPKKIRILTTKVEVRDDICEALMKLGVKFIKKPEQCTHLVATSFARTEKFLCALSNAPFVLNTSWLLESSAKNMILAESDYFLKDPAMEEKHDFKLTEALERARSLKKNNEKLLQGHFFYFTPNVSIDFDLMKNVIQTNGAECIQKSPTVRSLTSTRHVVSCEKDAKLWRPLAKQQFPIYSPELILTAACAQYVDWDGENKRVPGSI